MLDAHVGRNPVSLHEACVVVARYGQDSRAAFPLSQGSRSI